MLQYAKKADLKARLEEEKALLEKGPLTAINADFTHDKRELAHDLAEERDRKLSDDHTKRSDNSLNRNDIGRSQARCVADIVFVVINHACLFYRKAEQIDEHSYDKQNILPVYRFQPVF